MAGPVPTLRSVVCSVIGAEDVLAEAADVASAVPDEAAPSVLSASADGAAVWALASAGVSAMEAGSPAPCLEQAERVTRAKPRARRVVL
jgi:hypothetical protein